ncbi:NAD(P)/FAD-dependent oxidoreductase [Adhaeribacter sp. BT258]|uniref:NAD(P)/FAD-dependent oxidoreductase n=1 Tax=Adhaeribacter terrigena TaxID=2793070 RepID=A0ABS1BZ96_9BACT|nr:FAD-dependent oxidoreductase [Adhaeribacter terrigena]MBK0402452.1 NAD(P)/FAD-dependent oxidoreductase [Adhaeribacter terrigena]
MHILIIGNGIAGVTAALTIRKLSGYQVTIVSGENAHFYARTALMYLYLGQMRYADIKPYEDWFWAENNIALKHDWVNAIDFKRKTAMLASGEKISYDKVLLATGSQTNFRNWPGQNLKGVHGFYHLQDLQNIETATENCSAAVLVGGGLIGIELAEMLHARGIKVTMLVRDAHYWGRNLPPEEARLIEKRAAKNGIEIRLKTTLKELESDENGNVCAAITDKNERIPCTFTGIATGVIPNTELAKTCSIKTNQGILVNEYLETSQPDVYAAGDCTELAFKGGIVEQLWYTGRMQGEIAAHNICGRKIPYERGIPFNSAKFFDLELQTYGRVVPDPAKNETSFFWQNPEGTASLRVNYVNDKARSITGLVALGIRLRQEVCEEWIKEERPLASGLLHLKEANFDPEFQRRYENDILQAFKTQHPEVELPERKKKFRWF